MADVLIDSNSTNADELRGKGIKAFILQDYTTAVDALSKASEILVAQHGGDDLHPSLGEVYLYYGKALLGLVREEAEALVDAVPKNVGEEDDEDDSDDEGADEVEETPKKDEPKEDKPQPESSAENGENKEAATTTEGAEEEGEPTDLQLAWEVLEFAKKIYEKQGEEGRKNLAESLTVLGEISLENENFEGAVNDIKQGLEIQKQIFGKTSRTVAESCYKLGIALSMNNQIDEAVEQFKLSLECLKGKVEELEKIGDKKDEIEEEIKEIKGLMPDIEEKISDMKTYKDEKLKNIVAEAAKLKDAPTSSSVSSSSSVPANDISHLVKRKRKLDDIVEEEESAEKPPTKKPATGT